MASSILECGDLSPLWISNQAGLFAVIHSVFEAPLKKKAMTSHRSPSGRLDSDRPPGTMMDSNRTETVDAVST
jgi:hypothetical protein